MGIYEKQKLMISKQIGRIKITHTCIKAQMNLKMGYQPRNNFVRDQNDLLADFHNVLNRWEN